MKVNEIQQLPPKILFCGKSGTGKTALSATGGEKVQILDMDRGILTALTFKDKWFDERQKVDVITCYEDGGPDKAVAFRKAKEHIYNVANACAKGTYPFKVFVVDTLTTLSDASMRMIRISGGKWTLAPQLDVKRGVTQPEWGLAINEVQQVLSVLRNLPIAVIVNAHVQEIEAKLHPETGQILQQARYTIQSVGSKLPEMLPAYFDEVIYAQTNVVAGGSLDYVIRTKKIPGMDFLRTRAQIPDGTKIDKGLPELLKLARYDITEKEPTSEPVKPTTV